jgi:NNP family nitrate/nitrite transporter-like MFS transporter
MGSGTTGEQAAAPADARVLPGGYRALVLATLGFAINFWAWALLSPLAPRFAESLDLSPLAASVMVAVPVIIGSLGRIPLGALTDRYGGKRMFALVSYVAIVPVAFLAFADSYVELLAGGFVLGLAGASFAVGVPYVNGFFPPARRGLALGIFGMGNVGTAVSTFLTPRITDAYSRSVAFLLVAALLALVGTAFLLIGPEIPGRSAGATPFLSRFVTALKNPIAQDLAAIYAITFGGFVAFGAYLPLYLRAVYGLSVTGAASRAAGFVLLATFARPVGGWLADRFTAVPVLLGAPGVVAVGAIAVSFEPSLGVAAVFFLAMAAALGVGNGAVFALVGVAVPPAQVGSVTGVVGAAGGLGGFLPPIIMGAVYGATESYAIGLMLLSDVAFAGLVYVALKIRPYAGAGARAVTG